LQFVCTAAAISAEASPAAKSPLEAFTPEVTGYLYYSLDGSSGADKANAFDISRVYVGGKYALADNFTFRYVSDIGHETGGGKFEVYTKYAYLDWKLGKPADLIFGLQGTKNFNMPESEWSYRGIRKSPMESFGDFYGGAILAYTKALDSRIASLAGGSTGDQQLADRLTLQKAAFVWSSRNKMGSSADQSIDLSLKPDENTYIDINVLNGSGYKKAEDDKYKNFQVRAGRYLSNKKVHLSGYVEFEPWSYTGSNGVKKSYTNIQWDLLAVFSAKDKGKLGINYNGKKFGGSYEDITAACFSVFGNVNLGRKDLKALARYDYYSTGFNKSAAASGAPALKTNANLFILGLDYQPNSRVHIIPDLQLFNYQNPAVNANNVFYLHMLVSL